MKLRKPKVFPRSTAMALFITAGVLAPLGLAVLSGCGSSNGELAAIPPGSPAARGLPTGPANQDQVTRGRYLVTAIGDCAGCHNRGKGDPSDPHWLAGFIGPAGGQAG